MLKNSDRLRADIDRSGSMTGFEKYEQQAVGMLTGGRVRNALDLAKEPQATRDRYGKHLWAQQLLLACRLVQAGPSLPFNSFDNFSTSAWVCTDGVDPLPASTRTTLRGASHAGYVAAQTGPDALARLF